MVFVGEDYCGMVRLPEAAREHRWTGLAAVFAIAWMFARAAAQSITIDEADTYIVWVSRFYPSHWEPGSNNHILNSILIRLVTSCFGLSHFSVRVPALLGGILYVTVAYWLCLKLLPAGISRWAVLVCLTFNPFLFDYFVAARGYSLAVAFLIAAVAIAFSFRLHPDRQPTAALLRRCVVASACLGLSFSANFSFAFVCAATLAVVFASALSSRQAEKTRFARDAASIAAALIFPGAGVSLFLCGSALSRWNRAELFYGAHSLAEALRSVTEATLYRPNPNLINPLWLGAIDRVSAFLLPAIAVLLIAHGAVLLWERRRARSAPDRLALEFGAMLISILVLTGAAHELAFRSFRLPLPMARTALYTAPLCTLIAGTAVSLRAQHDLFRRGLAVSMVVLAGYFFLCLRIGYFKEWYWDAEVQQAYRLTAHHARTHGIDRVFANWKYVAGLEFYRRATRNFDLREVTSTTKAYPTDFRLYVLDPSADQEFIEKQHLQRLYEGELSDIVIAGAPAQGGGGN